MRITVAAVSRLVLALAACGDASEPPPAENSQASAPAPGPTASSEPADPVDTNEGATITLTDAGVMFGGAQERTLRFGTSRDDAESALAQLLGTPDTGSNEECGVGPIEYARAGGLQFNFQNDQFVGWSADSAGGDVPIAAMNGLKIGTAKSEVSKLPGYEAYEESTLGDEFTISRGGENVVVGLFDEDGRVTDLWSGAVCTFR